MKKVFFNKIVLTVIALFTIIACQDRELVTVDNQSAPIALDTSTQTLFLDKNFPTNPALTLSWTAATYTVPTEIRYKIEVSADSKFTTPYVLGNVAESIRTATFTVEQMNKASQSIGLATGVASKMYIRITSYLGTVSENVLATSNISSITITPYELVYPDFYLVGASAYMGWDSTNAQLLYKKKNMSYIYTNLTNNQPFRFLGQQAWNPTNYSLYNSQIRAAYRYFIQNSNNLSLNGTDDENILYNGTSGVCKISIDATDNVHSIDVTLSPLPDYNVANLYLVGSMNSWNASNPLSMSQTSTGVFTITTTLADDAQFKFIGQKSFGNLEWGNILSNNDGNSGYIGPKGDNSNIVFKGGNSNYKITVNLKAGIYSIVKQ